MGKAPTRRSSRPWISIQQPSFSAPRSRGRSRPYNRSGAREGNECWVALQQIHLGVCMGRRRRGGSAVASRREGREGGSLITCRGEGPRKCRRGKGRQRVRQSNSRCIDLGDWGSNARRKFNNTVSFAGSKIFCSLLQTHSYSLLIRGPLISLIKFLVLVPKLAVSL
jgi:hypothetical protein